MMGIIVVAMKLKLFLSKTALDKHRMTREASF